MDKVIDLIEAIKRGNKEAVERLLSEGADVNAQDQYGVTPLHWAAMQGHQFMAASLVEADADVNAQDPGGKTPLHWAAISGQTIVAAYLIAQSTHVNVRDNNDYTPLYLAISCRRASATQLLLSEGAYCARDASVEKILESWLKLWKTRGFPSETHILCGITMLLAGVPIRDAVLPKRLQKVKEGIYARVAEWLNPLKLASKELKSYIPSVLRALPPVMHLAEYIHKAKEPTIGSDYQGALKQLFLQDPKKMEESNSSIIKALYRQLPPELRLMVRESLRDKEIVETLSVFYSLDSSLMDDIWCGAQLNFDQYKTLHIELSQEGSVKTPQP